jgi:hypothetical protein
VALTAPAYRRRSVASELPNIRNFEAASSFVDREDIRAAVGCGPDPSRHLEVAQRFVDAGLDRLAVMNSGLDVEGFFHFYERELSDAVREPRPSYRDRQALVRMTNRGPLRLCCRCWMDIG